MGATSATTDKDENCFDDETKLRYLTVQCHKDQDDNDGDAAKEY